MTPKTKIQHITHILRRTAKALEKAGAGRFSVTLHLHGGTLVEEAGQSHNLQLRSHNGTSWFAWKEDLTQDAKIEFAIYL